MTGCAWFPCFNACPPHSGTVHAAQRNQNRLDADVNVIDGVNAGRRRACSGHAAPYRERDFILAARAAPIILRSSDGSGSFGPPQCTGSAQASIAHPNSVRPG